MTTAVVGGVAPPEQQTRFDVVGADATNLVGYLYGLGALALLQRALPAAGVTLRWQEGAAWHPVIELRGAGSAQELAGALLSESRLLAETLPGEIGVDLPPPLAPHRAALRAAREAGPSRWLGAALLAGMASDIPERSRPGAREARALDSALRTMSGAGHQHFIGTIRDLLSRVTVDDVRASLCGPWMYRGEKLGLRWDPAEDRRHALMSRDPTASGNAIASEYGATVVAWAALAMLPVLPQAKDVVTVGSRAAGRKGAPEAHFRLPIWREALSLPVVASLLVHPAIWDAPPDARVLRRIGIAEVVQFRRYPTGKFRNFAQGALLLGN